MHVTNFDIVSVKDCRSKVFINQFYVFATCLESAL